MPDAHWKYALQSVGSGKNSPSSQDSDLACLLGMLAPKAKHREIIPNTAAMLRVILAEIQKAKSIIIPIHASPFCFN
jgi:hypothetical protein